MTIKQALLHNTGWKIVAMLFAFINNLLIVRLLGITESASLFYAIAIFTFLGTLLKASLENGIIYYLSQHPASKKLLLQMVAIVTTFQFFLVFIILKFFMNEVATFNIICATIFIVANITLYYITSFFQVEKMFLSVNLISCLCTFLQTIILVVCFFNIDAISFFKVHFSSNKNMVFAIMAFASSLQVITLFIYFIKQVRFDSATIPIWKSLKAVAKFSYVNYICAMLLFLIMRADLYFVEKYCDTDTLSNYIQASKIGQLLLVFPGLLGGVIFPYTATDQHQFQPKINGLIRIITLLFFAGFFMSLFIGNALFTCLLGANFNLMNHMFLLSYVGIYSLTISILLISFYEGLNKQRIIIVANGITLLFLLVGDYILVPKFGYEVAAIIFSLSNLIGLVVLLLAYTALNRSSFSDLFIIRKQDIASLQFWKKI